MFGKLFRRSASPAPVTPIRDVLMTQEAVDDPDLTAPVETNITIVNHLLQTFRYKVEELPPEAIQSYAVDFYMAQVMNGGHEQFAHNANGQPHSWTFARSGLAAMGAAGHLRTFERFEHIIQRGDKRARDLIAGGGFGPADPEVEEIDDAFYAAEEQQLLAELNSQWLRALPNLRVLPAAQLESWINELADDPAVSARMQRR